MNDPNQKDYLEKLPFMYQEASPVTESRENKPGVTPGEKILELITTR